MPRPRADTRASPRWRRWTSPSVRNTVPVIACSSSPYLSPRRERFSWTGNRNSNSSARTWPSSSTPDHMTIDINCDMGESTAEKIVGDDAAIMPFISSANIACGFHGGSPAVMRDTIALALRHGVALGAHPSFPDLEGFGRREMDLPPRDVHALV